MARGTGPERKIEDLRRQAEAQVNRQADISAEQPLSMPEIIQELRIHQAELEIQNEELIRAENEMAELYNQYHNLFEFAPFGYIIIDARGIVKQANQNAAELLETDLLNFQGKALATFFSPDSEQAFYKSRQAAAISGQTMSIDLPLTKKDGSRLWCRFVISADLNEDQTLNQWRLALLDITLQYKAEQERQRIEINLNEILEAQVAQKTEEVHQQQERLRGLANRLARTEQDERKRLARVLHDEIQPTIISARMHLWKVRRANTGSLNSPEILDKVEIVLEKSLNALRSLTVDLNPPVLEKDGLSGPLTWLASRMKSNYSLCVNLYADTPVQPRNEEVSGLVFECVRELLLNTVKHSGTLEADVAVSGTPGETLKVVVSDQGKGFDPALLNDQNPELMNFGLFSIQERLAYIGGNMTLETAPGTGLKVTLTVPAAEAPEHKAPDESGFPADSSKTGISVHGREHLIGVLIVDDHKVLREGLRGMLQLEKDIQILGEAANGFEAVQLAGELKPDVVIMDVNLGEMDGVEATRRILARHPGIKVIGLSMHDDTHIRKSMLNAGAVAYFTKSGPSEDLICAVLGAE
jgi:PAS domain S-box-containing protein